MKKQLISIAKSITVFILLIFCAVVIDARAEDYLWEPTLAWEDPSPGIGHKLLNNDEWLIYYADNKVQLRELATGKKLAESEDLLQLLNEKGCGSAYFSMSNDGKLIYCLSGFTNTRHLFIFDSKDLKIIKRIKVLLNTKGMGTHYVYENKYKFYLSYPQNGYIVSDNDYRIILKTNYDYQGNYPTPGGNIPFKPDGVCIISFNPQTTSELNLDNKDSYKMLFYNETKFIVPGLYKKGEIYHYLDMISMNNIYSSNIRMFLSKNRKYVLLYGSEYIQVVDVHSKETLRNYPTSEVKKAGWKNNELILYGSDLDKIYMNFERFFFFDFFCFDYYQKKSFPMFSETMKKHFFSKLVQFGETYVLADDNLNYLIFRGRNDLSVYKLFERSDVQDNNDKGIIVDSVNANIPIPNGKYPKYISIYTSDGKLVEESKEITIDRDYIRHNIELLPAGLYLLRLSYEDGNTMTYKIIK